MSAPETKLSVLKQRAAANDWRGAISVAAKFPVLGAEKDAIMAAHEAFVRPDFQRQLGRDCEALIEAGIAALRGKYNV